MFDEKLIVKQFMENQKLALPSSLNAANLTLVLRSLGFFLHEFDVDSNGANAEDKNLSVEIKCGHSGIISKLYLPYHDCHCEGENPPKEKAFWEVHGNQPISPSCSNPTPSGSQIVHETATNLLPEADQTWKILAKNMFHFMLRMQNEIANYKDDQNNMQYDEPVANGPIETGFENNEEASPVFLPIKPDTPFSTPLSSINVTPIVATNSMNVISSTSISNIGDNNSYNEESMVIALVMEAKSKLDEALLRLKFRSDDDLFNSSGLSKLTTKPITTPSTTSTLPDNKSIVRRRSTNSSVGSNSSFKSEGVTSRYLTHIPSRYSVDYNSQLDTKKPQTEKKITKPVGTTQKGTSKLLCVPTRTSALRKQTPK